MIWTIIEPGVAIVASSLATIRPLLRAMKIHGFESTRRTLSAPSAHARYTAEDRGAPIASRVFGPDDVSLKHVEPSYDAAAAAPKSLTKTTTIGLTIEPSHAGRATGPRLDTQQAGIGRGSEGKEYSPARSVNTEASHTTHSSFDNIHSLEAQSQDSEYFGYIPDRRGR